MQNSILFLLFIGFTALASYGAVNFVRVNLHQQLIDIPNARSSHVLPTPRGGGLGFIAVFTASIAIYNLCFPSQSTLLPLLLWLSFVPLVAIGLLDDWKNLSASVRYSVQFSVATMLVWQIGAFPQPWLQSLGTLGSCLAFVITIIGVTAAMNFYNFMDGLDGLVAGCCFVQVIYCSIYLSEVSLLILAAALLGFLVCNWSPAKIFMGDAGSTFLGASIPTFLLVSAQSSQVHTAAESWGSLVVTLPLIFDALYTLSRRWRNGENIFQAHRSHIYQRLNQAGFSHASVAGIYVCLTIAAAVAFLLLGVLGAALSLFALCFAMVYAEKLIEERLPDSLSTVQLTRISDS